MKTVEQMLAQKGHALHAIAPDATVFAAIELMAAKNVGALVVLDAERLVGILSERDYARKVILQGKSSRDTPVREVMTGKVLCVTPRHTVGQCMALMTAKHVRHLPVLEHKKVTGMVSIGDVVKETISEQQFIIAQLENYIHQ